MGVILFVYFVFLMEFSLSILYVVLVLIWKLILGLFFNFIVVVIFDGILFCIVCIELIFGVNWIVNSDLLELLEEIEIVLICFFFCLCCL